MSLHGSHILSTEQFDLDSLAELFELADFVQPIARGECMTRVLEGAVLGSLFFEASTRTRLSFDAAFMRLGGAVSHTTGFNFSSIIKGESLEDTSRVISGYVDIFVVRHPDVHSIQQFAKATHVPVINGGNGEGEHPTQALLDIYTMRNELRRVGKKIDGSTVAMVGDLRYGRTIHSLVRLLLLYKGTKFIFAAPQTLAIPDFYRDLVAKGGHEFVETTALDDQLKNADVIYMTRVQKERMPVTERFDDSDLRFRMDAEHAKKYLRHDTVVMHPLPRDSTATSNDLSTELDGDPRIAIFRQTDSGVPIRMALFGLVMGVETDIRRALRTTTWWRPRLRGPKDCEFPTPPK